MFSFSAYYLNFEITLKNENSLKQICFWRWPTYWFIALKLTEGCFGIDLDALVFWCYFYIFDPFFGPVVIVLMAWVANNHE